MEHATEPPRQRQLLGGHQPLFLPRSGGLDVDGREHALLRQRAVQPDLPVTRSLELLEDDLVHPGPGLHERAGDDRQRPALFQVPGSPEEPLRGVQGGGVHPSGQDSSGRRCGQVVGAGQPGDRVQEDGHVPTLFDQPLRPFQDQLGHLRVLVGGLVEGRVHDLRGGHRPLPVRDLLGSFVDQEDHHVDVRVVLDQPAGDLLQHGGLAGLRRGHDHPSLALSDGSDQVDDPLGDALRVVLEPDALIGEQRRQLVEVGPLASGLRVDSGHGVDAQEGGVLLVVPRWANGPGDLVAPAQAEPPDLGERHVHVGVARKVAARPKEAVPLGQHVEDPRPHWSIGQLLLPFLSLPLPPTIAIAPALLTRHATGALAGDGWSRTLLHGRPNTLALARLVGSVTLISGHGGRLGATGRLDRGGLGRCLDRCGRSHVTASLAFGALPGPSLAVGRAGQIEAVLGGLGHDGVDQVALLQPLMTLHAERLGHLLKLRQNLGLQIRPVECAGIHVHAPSFSSCWSFFQSLKNFSRPMSVRGCFTSWENTLNGMVATSAPALAASTTCMGWRREAARTSVS